MTTTWQTRAHLSLYRSPDIYQQCTCYIVVLLIFCLKKETTSKSDEKWTLDMEKCLTKCHFSPSWPLFFQNGQGYILHFLHQAVFHCKKCCVKIKWKLNKAYLKFCQILEKYHFGYWPYSSTYISETVRAAKNIFKFSVFFPPSTSISLWGIF